MGKPVLPLDRVVVVGLGGIGSAHIFELSRKMSRYKGWPRELVLIDGDMYTESNLDRQQVLASDVGQNKARCWASALATEYKNLEISAVTAYVGDKNIGSLKMERAAILLGVDNHPTRKLFSKYVEKVHKDFLLICGGNERTDGSIISYLRVGGMDMTPPLTTFHPEIENPKGKNPADLSCAELAKLKGGEQIMDANATAARVMMHILRLAIEGDKEEHDFKEAKKDVPEGTKCSFCQKAILEAAGKSPELEPLCALCNLKVQSEVYFDITSNTVRPRARFVPGMEIKKKEEAETAVGPKEEGSKQKVKAAKTRGKVKAAKTKEPDAAPAGERRIEVVVPPAPEMADVVQGPARDQTIGGPAAPAAGDAIQG